MKRSVLFMLFFLPALAFAQVGLTDTSPRGLGMGMHLLASQADCAGRTFNPAAGHEVPSLHAQGNFRRTFNMKELDEVQLLAARPFGNVTASLFVSQFGDKKYNETSVVPAVSYAVHPSFVLGAGLHASRQEIDHYPNSSLLSSSLGMLVLRPRYQLGFSVRDAFILASDQLSENEPEPTACAGAEFAISKTWTVFLESQTNLNNFDPSAALGVELALFPALTLRTGADSRTDRLHAGMTLHTKNIDLHFSYDHHPQLGWTPGIGVVFVGATP